MRFVASVVDGIAAFLAVATAAAVVIVALPFIAVYRLLRWAELQYVYGGDTKARDKDRWRGL